MSLNLRCAHDVSDEDCNKCVKRGIIFRCPDNCEFYDDILKDAPKEFMIERQRLMDILGVEYRFTESEDK